jgi:hypothetical protein
MARAIRMLLSFAFTVVLFIGITLFLSISFAVAFAMRKYVPTARGSDRPSDALVD